jgi:hypothetical protein
MRFMSYKKLDVWQLAREQVDDKLYQHLRDKLELLSKKLNMFLQSVEKGHISEK